MAQFVVYGHSAALRPRIAPLSDALHAATVDALKLPEEKRFHRFVPLDDDCFIHPPDRSADYTIIEISMFEGRSVEARKSLVRGIYSRLGALGIAPQDVEVTITETPKSNWGIRGVPADELSLNYSTTV